MFTPKYEHDKLCYLYSKETLVPKFVEFYCFVIFFFSSIEDYTYKMFKLNIMYQTNKIY